MRRRQFLAAAIGALVAIPSFVRAQQSARIWRVGFIAHRYEKFYDPLFTGLRELGYVEGQTINIEYRWAEGKYDRLPDLATELVHLKVDVIVAVALAIRAAKRATQTTHMRQSQQEQMLMTEGLIPLSAAILLWD